MPDERRFEGESIVDWGVRTGRFRAERADFWRNQLADEQRQIRASGGQPRNAASQIEATIASLHPAYAEEIDNAPQPRVPGSPWITDASGRTVWAGAYGSPAASSETPTLDALEEAMYGPSRDERRRREDLAGEAELRASIDNERQQHAQFNLTADEMRELFGDDAA